MAPADAYLASPKNFIKKRFAICPEAIGNTHALQTTEFYPA